MTSRPILFSAPMVRALLNGSKTQTRRVVKLKPWHQIEEKDSGQPWPWMYDSERDADHWVPCPHGQPGDELWVRETLDHDAARGHFYKATGMYVGPLLDYEREPPPAVGLPARAIPSIHMPRWASRITLRITEVRVERLQDISEADAIAEGAEPMHLDDLGQTWRTHTRGYQALWESINGPGSWDANPWVWALTFERTSSGG